MRLHDVTLFVITKNEEHNLKRLLGSCPEFDEVVVVDSGSTDNTVEIAKSYGASVFINEFKGYGAQKQFALEKCSSKWVINMDADEAFTSQLVDEINSIVNSNDVYGVRFRRTDMFIGRPLHNFTRKPHNLRMFKRQNGHFDVDKRVHETANVNGLCIESKYDFIHYGYTDIPTLIDKTNQYSTLKSNEKYGAGKKASLLKLILVFQVEFFRKFILYKYCFSGRRGFILSIIDAFYAFQKEAKLYSMLQHKQQLASKKK